MAMNETGSKANVLVIGLDPYRVPGPWDPKPVADAIQTGMAGLENHGFHAEACLVGLDGLDAVANHITSALQNGHWDCVLVGGGIRHSEEQLELFESVINLIRKYAPRAAVAFNRVPHDLADSVIRALQCKA